MAAKRNIGKEILNGLRELEAGRNGRVTTVSMETVSVRELRRNLSAYLDRVKVGMVFRITERGRVVALLIPIPHSAAIERLIASGWATTPKRDHLNIPKPKGKPSRRVSKALLWDRKDRI